MKWNDGYGMEREKYYNRNGLEIGERVMKGGNGKDIVGMLINRERDIQNQVEEERIRQAKYNKKYKELKIELEGPIYLRKSLEEIRSGEGIRTLIKLRCRI
ncbi:hypothetical protein P5V15_009260 [Pogonomyrmex californicus]